jgi:23S rRNA (guanosine2251-2'-O)-methyltransferase
MNHHKDETIAVWGRHAVYEAVKNVPQAVKKVLFEGGKQDDQIKNAARAGGISIDGFPAGQAPRFVPDDAVHQGFVAVIDPSKLLHEYQEFIKDYPITDNSCFVLLGEIQDPHNVGAVIRSAAAFGVSGVIIPEHRQAPLTGTVFKVSAGMAFRIPLITIGNVNQTLRDLKDRGFWTYGLDQGAQKSVADEGFEKPTVLILGNEATGIREKTMELCDIPLRIPMSNRAESLNASASASVALFAWSTKHPKALQ